MRIPAFITGAVLLGLVLLRRKGPSKAEVLTAYEKWQTAKNAPGATVYSIQPSRDTYFSTYLAFYGEIPSGSDIPPPA